MRCVCSYFTKKGKIIAELRFLMVKKKRRKALTVPTSLCPNKEDITLKFYFLIVRSVFIFAK